MNSSSQNIWERLVDQLRPILGQSLHLVTPELPAEDYRTWFHELEIHSFRESLRYNDKELEERLKKDEVLYLFLATDNIPECVILGYPATNKISRTFYLDTFAILRKGKGIGRIVLNHIIEWAKANDYVAIELDTEAENEVGLPLQRFYETAGFEVQNIEDDGNITMSLTL